MTATRRARIAVLKGRKRPRSLRLKMRKDG
jgi:hypothetical protein